MHLYFLLDYATTVAPTPMQIFEATTLPTDWESSWFLLGLTVMTIGLTIAIVIVLIVYVVRGRSLCRRSPAVTKYSAVQEVEGSVDPAQSSTTDAPTSASLLPRPEEESTNAAATATAGSGQCFAPTVLGQQPFIGFPQTLERDIP